MDYSSYRQALGLNFGDYSSKISALKTKIYNEQVNPLVAQDTMANFSLTDAKNKIDELKNNFTGISDTLGGGLTTVGSMLGMKKLNNTIKAQSGNKTDLQDQEEAIGDDDMVSSIKKAVTQAPEQIQEDGNSLIKQIGSFVKNKAAQAKLTTPDAVTDTPLAKTTVKTPHNGEIDTTEPFGSATDKGIEMKPMGKSVGTVAADESTSEATGAAEETATGLGEAAGVGAEEAGVAAVEGVAAGMDAIPFVDIGGALLGIGAAIFGAVEGGKELSFENQENANNENLEKAKAAVSNKISGLDFTGSSVIPTLSSTGSMPINAGVF